MLNDQMMEVTRIFSDPKSADVIGHNNPFFSPSVNFTYVLLKYFMRTDPKSAKKTDGSTVFFALLGSSQKAACKMLMKMTPCANFTNVLHAAFTIVGPKRAKRHCILIHIQDLRA